MSESSDKVNFKISNKIKILLTSLLAAVVLLWAIFGGISAGKNIAQAKIVIQTAQNTAKSLQYFYQDQNRYPSAVEFADQNLMLNYMSNFPLPDYSSANCNQSFNYQRPDPADFTLSFCLPTANGNYLTGWNSINGNSGK